MKWWLIHGRFSLWYDTCIAFWTWSHSVATEPFIWRTMAAWNANYQEPTALSNRCELLMPDRWGNRVLFQTPANRLKKVSAVPTGTQLAQFDRSSGISNRRCHEQTLCLKEVSQIKRKSSSMVVKPNCAELGAANKILPDWFTWQAVCQTLRRSMQEDSPAYNNYCMQVNVQ